MNFKKTVLPNGLTILSVPVADAPSVTVLVTVAAGSKYETKETNGLSHFLEHMCFKGTTKRPTASIIASELDGLGSSNNAFTTQEFTGYYAKAHPKHVDKIIDIIADLYLDPLFDEKEIEKEKGVIIDEIRMYEDMPHRTVHEVFMRILYGDTPAGWEIIGPKENILKMTHDDFIRYRNANYIASATTVTVAGHFDEATLVEKISKAFEKIPTGEKSPKLPVIEKQDTPKIEIKKKETDQAHIIVGVRAFDASDKRMPTLRILNAVLGGGMSSRLFLKLREEMGVGYHVQSYHDEYTDHGYLAASVGVDTARTKEVVEAILREMKRLSEEYVPDAELQKAKDFSVGHLYLGLESSDSLAEFYAIQHITSKEIFIPAEMAEQMFAVTKEDIMTLAKEIMKDSGLNMAIVGNISDPASLEQIFHF